MNKPSLFKKRQIDYLAQYLVDIHAKTAVIEEDYVDRDFVKVSFFGRALNVRCVPYQEQDSAVAACATCALWSALQVTAAVFGHKEFSPGMVTATATEHGMSLLRSFPNRSGLCAQDMAYAVRHLGLDLVSISLEGGSPVVSYGAWMYRRILLGNLFAYLGLGVPIVLLGIIQLGDGRIVGGHAVVVNGYRLSDAQHGQSFKDLRIQKIYCHDDQYGPYMGLELRDTTTAVFNARWPEPGEGELNPIFIQKHLFIPVYHKVRVSYEEVWSSVYEFGHPLRGQASPGGYAPLR